MRHATLLPQWAAYGQMMANTPGPARGASRAGQPFLADVLPDARIVVEIAWGAQLAADPASWAWTDITTDVYQNPGISFTYGRANEASTTQPAKGTMTLDNSQARYSLGGISPNWPNVIPNVPVRIRIDPIGTGFVVAFQGNATGFKPGWDRGGKIATVALTVAGTMRRLIQGSAGPVSSAKRYYTGPVAFKPIVYYPLDEGALALSGKALIGIGNAVIDPVFLGATGDLNFPGKFFGQGRLASWMAEGIALNKFAVLLCDVPATPKTTVWWVLDIMASFSDGDPTTGLFQSITSQENGESGWGVRLDAFNKQVTVTGNVPGAGPVDLFTVSETLLFNGDVHHLRLWVNQNGANIDIVLYINDVARNFGSLPNLSIQHPQKIIVFASEPSKRFYGHVAFWNNITWAPFGNLAAFYTRGAVGDSAIARTRRLCVENRINLDVIGEPATTEGTALMGPQVKEDLVVLLRQNETADQGILFDGLSDGLSYACRDARENAPAVLTINVAGAELAPEFLPDHDDQRRVNLARAKRDGGTEVLYEDVSGPLGTAAIGTYDGGTLTVNTQDDARIGDYAAWAVHLGTVDGYRYPSVTLDIRANPRFAPLVLALRPGHRIDLTGVRDTFYGHSEQTISLLVEGVTMTITPFRWLVTLQCSPFDPWRIITLAAPTGDTAETVCHLQTSGSVTTAEVLAGATAVTVATTTGPVWTQSADDFPFDILIGGVRATVTAVTGAASPQTFTILPMSLTRTSGAPVEVFQPPALRL